MTTETATTETTEAPRRFKSKTEAAAARVADLKTARETRATGWRSEALQFLATLDTTLADADAKVRAIASLHMPEVPASPSAYENTLRCPKCNDNASYDVEMDKFPCETMDVIVRDLGLGAPPVTVWIADAEMVKPFEHYWPDPCVTVTFAEQALLTDKATGRHWLIEPEEQRTLRFSVAYELRWRLLPSSRERVEAMA